MINTSEHAYSAGIDRLADSPQDAFEIKLCLRHRSEQDTAGGLRIFQSIVRLELVANPPAHVHKTITLPGALSPSAARHHR